MVQYFVIIALSILVLILLAWIYIIKKNIRQVRDELKKTEDEDYNRQLRVSLIDGDVEALASEINHNLEYQRSLKLETERSRRQLEQSISDIAHDLRTPLTVVKGNLQMLEKEQLTDKGRDYLDISRRKADTLKGMVDEFFELSVLESDSKVAELRKIDVISFLSEFIVENETLIREKELTPEITFPEKTVFIQADKELLSRVFSNLFTNILKYAKDCFEIKVTGDDAAGLCTVQIGNNVAEPETIDIEHIFDRTYRADKARRDGSAGLGLYIAKLLVEKQKGSITAGLEGNKLLFNLVFKEQK